MSRYLIFAFDRMNPGGGWTDFVASHNSLEIACKEAAVFSKAYEFVQVVDSDIAKVISVYFNPER